MKVEEIFERLWSDYTKQNPHALKVWQLFTDDGEAVVNDHIAFRTFDDPRVDVDVLAKPFLESGYEFCGSYEFKDKRLFAKHFEHKTMKDVPRVFISQLISKDFSPFLQKAITSCIDAIPESHLNSDELIFSGNLWGKPSYEIYERLRAESEYAAWVYVWGYCANHFTVSVNNLHHFNSLEKVNDFLKQHGFALNDSGGEIKGTPEELLEQSSTKSGIVSIDFTEGSYEIPSAYYEFARRYADQNGQLYSGFIAKSADKIFESTDFYKK
ncbi:MAG: DUF1338 domain-containing protein [Bacteroidota bacterium]